MRFSQLFAIAFVSMIVPGAFAQSSDDPLDQYIADAEMIAVVRCISSGPVNKIARALVTVEILHLAKGTTNEDHISTEIVGGLKPGDLYLLRIKKPGVASESGSLAADRNDVIPIPYFTEIEKLRTLPLRIVVLRTINIRMETLENQIRAATFEKTALASIKGKN